MADEIMAKDSKSSIKKDPNCADMAIRMEALLTNKILGTSNVNQR